MTDIDTINKKALKDFITLSGMTTEQFLLAINDVSLGDGAKITLANLILSMISNDTGNSVVVGTDNKLKATDLIISDNVIFGETDYGGTVADNLNTITKNGFYTCYGAATGAPSNTYSWFVIHQNSNVGTVSATQRAVAYNSTPIVYERIKTSSTWGAWVEQLRFPTVETFDSGGMYMTKVGSVISSIIPYSSSLYIPVNSALSTSIGTIGTYHTVLGAAFLADTTSTGFTWSNGVGTCTRAGYYWVEYTASVYCATAGKKLAMCIFKNGEAVAGSHSTTYEATINQPEVVSGKRLVLFAVRDTVSLGITNLTTALATLIDCATFNIIRRM